MLVAAGLVATATVVAFALHAGPATASLLYLTGVLLASLRGLLAGTLASLLSFVTLNYAFTPPIGSFQVAKRQDLEALLAFLAVAFIVGSVTARMNELRHRAEQREREARIRLDLTQRLLAGAPPQHILAEACDALVGLFGLARCDLRMGPLHAHAYGSAEPGVPLSLSLGELSLSLRTGRHRPLGTSDRAVLEALASGLATALAVHRLEAAAAEARLAAEVNETRSGFLSAVSHNLKTPLAAIKTSVSALLETGSQLAVEDRVALLETIHEEGDRLERLVSKVLDLSRIRAGGLHLDLRDADLVDLARAAARRLQPLARAHTLRLELAEGLPEVCVDVTLLEQVFLNLLENALRYAPPGSEIVIAARRINSEVEARVIDHGCGVPPAQREPIFEEFFRGEGTRESSGTGLGLAIVRAVVHAHSGRVWCEETPGGGVTFVFRLPMSSTYP